MTDIDSDTKVPDSEIASDDMARVIAKIQKLLSRTKSGSGTSEAEADTAMRLAQELMTKHNLDMATIEASDPSAAPSATERVQETSKSSVRYKWQRMLAKYVAEAHFCYHLLQSKSVWAADYVKKCEEAGDHDDHIGSGRRRSCFIYDAEDLQRELKQLQEDKQKGYIVTEPNWKAGDHAIRVDGRYRTTHSHIFVGRKANVITAQLMFQYLCQTIENNVPLEDNSQRLSRSAMSWKEGCAERLCERLSDRRRDLLKKHDAEVKAAEAARMAERQRQQAEKDAKTPKQLPANEGAELDAAHDRLKQGTHVRVGGTPGAVTDRPEIADDDTWNPADAVPEEEDKGPGTSMVLASVYDQSERDANYELAWGLEPGALAKRRAADEEAERLAAEEEAKAESERIEQPVKEETERQRAAREKRENDEYAKRRRRWARENDAAARREMREYLKKDHKAFAAGSKAGGKIGLDMQVKAKSGTKQLTGRK